MKVIIIGPAHPLRGGLASYNERLAKEFIALGHNCRIITYSLQYPSFLFPGKTQYSDQPPPDGIPIEVKINSIHPFNWFKVGRSIRNEKPDLLIFRYWMPFMAPAQGTIARQVRKNKHTRIIAITDNIIPHERFIFGRAMTKYFVNSCDAFITMSQSVLNDLLQIRKDARARFVPHPLYDNFGEPVSRDEALKVLDLDPAFRYILFFGFIRRYKGLELLLRAFADPRLKDKPVKLIIAGEYYEDATHYKTIISETGLTERVIQCNDFIPDDKVRYYFSVCDLVAQTYIHATQSGVTQVAYHFNKPMLVTDVGGLSEMVPHGKVGYVVKPDSKAVADAFIEFYHSGEPDKFSEGLQIEKKKYSWKLMVESILNS